VTAGDLTERVCADDDGEAEGERDAEESDIEAAPAPAEPGGEDRRADDGEHQQERAERLSREPRDERRGYCGLR
jgi:hypothetical protein